MTPGQVFEQLVSEALAASPGAAAVFVRHGMECVGCLFARFETVREAAVACDVDPEALVQSLARAARGSAKRTRQ